MHTGTVVTLPLKTRQELGIDCDALRHNSHAQVWVQCLHCDETFQRPWCMRHTMHACATASIDNQRDESVSAELTLAPHDIYHRVLAYAEQQHIVDTAALLATWYEQSGRCYYSNTPLLLDHTAHVLYAAVIARRDWQRSCTHDNVIWISQAMHQLCGAANEEEVHDYMRQANLIEQPVRLECKLLDDRAVLPIRSRVTDAGYDLTSIVDIVVPAGGIAKIDTGIALSPPPGTYYTVDGRSSLGARGIMPFRGIIDATYTGPLVVALMNTSTDDYHVSIGDRVAQIIGNRIMHYDISVVSDFSPLYNQRGTNGFGSTGK